MNRSTAFDNDHLQDAYPAGIERSWWHVARNRVIARAFQRHIGKHEQVLEVGCGTGIVTSALRERGWNVTGVDLAGRDVASRRDSHLLLGVDALTLPHTLREGITVLALFDVIEHIQDAPAFLRSLLTAYPNTRQVVITVPARTELWTTFDDHYGHFRRYDRAMLRSECEAIGLRIDRLAYFFHALHPVILLNNLVRGRERATRFHAPESRLSIALNTCVGRLFALEAALLPGSLVGSSVIVVARRQASVHPG